MDKKQARQHVSEQLDAGVSKTQVFQSMTGSGIKDRLLASWIAGHNNRALYAQHQGKVRLLIAILLVQLLIVWAVCFLYAATQGGTGVWVFIAALSTLIAGSFIYGFYKNKVLAYNIYILLTITQLPQSLKGFADAPGSTAIGLGVTLAVLAYVYYVRYKLFPDYSFIWPNKVKGQYVFSN